MSFWQLLDDGVTTTGCRATRQAREFGRRRRSLPGEGGRRDWSPHAQVELRVLNGELDLLQSRANRGDQEGRQRKSERIGGEGEVAAHRRWQN
jgi:hypothetical protein